MADQRLFEFNPLRLAAWGVIFALTVTVLVVGRPLLVPLAIAIFVWILLSAIRSTLNRLLPAKQPAPVWLGNLVAILIVAVATYLSVLMITSQSDKLAAAIPVYQANFTALLESLADRFNLEETPTIEALLAEVDLGAVLTWVGDSVTALMSDMVLIAIYVGFLLAEERLLPAKIRHLHRDPADADRTSNVALEISASIQRYIGMKTVISLATGLVSYVILTIVGVDFAAIWALLVFFLNFIPTIGSIVAAVFPALLTLVQFDSITPFLVVISLLGGTQFVFGNVIEPAYMGKSLNLSSLMILLALSFWGVVWGLAGMFLAVPIMVMTGIICAQFKGLRWIAVILSTDGSLVSDMRSERAST
ncbi:MAG: AI-2E family transporter [Woeseiaceae bacterium]|nr:AI-2E family transporter [Woeseiaceae bacterium]